MASLAACAHRPAGPSVCETPPSFNVVLEAADRLNVDSQGRSLPTLVRVLTLKSSSKLESADFTDLWNKPDDILGEDVLQVDELTVDPEQTLARWYPRSPKATHVALVALYRQPAGSAWRSVVTLPAVPPELCVEETQPRTGPARPKDAQVKFHLEDFRVDARTF